ncbi:hypothetical protein C8Q74DRAFT_1250410 [Fomes fomentarius]|nr:hypothetical protein C8Q74DRAFT_1250410 [Fomes fomentarius]
MTPPKKHIYISYYVILAASRILQLNRIGTAAVTLLFYDWILNLEKDVSLVWSKRFTIPTTLYILNRYLWLVLYILDIVSVNPVDDKPYPSDNTLPLNRCSAIVSYQRFSSIIRYIPWAVFAAFRTYALTSRNFSLTAIVFCLALACVLPYVYSDTVPWVVSNGPPPLNCGFDYGPGFNTHTLQLRHLICALVVYVSRGALITSEAIVTVITWMRTYKYSQLVSIIERKESLPDVLLRNGDVPALLTGATLTLSLTGDASGLTVNTIAQVRDTITSILISRFLLDLLHLGAESDAGTTGEDQTPAGVILTSQVPDQASAFPSLLFEERQPQPDEGIDSADMQRVQEIA